MLNLLPILWLALWLVSGPVVADSYRCGRKLIRDGDTPAEVLGVCGEPRARDRGRESISGQAGNRVAVERWYYKRSSRSLERVVVFHQGRVVAIRTGRR